MVNCKALLLSASLIQLALGQSQNVPIQRKTQEDGGNTLFAYLCDENHEKVSTDRPIENDGVEIRVCIERGRFARLNDLYIMKINSFEFFKQVEGSGTVIQKAFDHGSPEERGQSRIGNCERGSEICSFLTILKPQFFEVDGTVKGIGNIALQTGRQQDGERHLELVDVSLGHRNTQEFYGMTGVTMEFAVEDGYNKNPLKYARWNFRDHWHDSPDHIQGLYIGALVVAIVFCFALCAGLILWRQCCADVVTLRRRSREAPEQPDPIFVYTKGREKEQDLSETHSVDDDLEVGSSTEDEESVPSYDLLTYNDQSTRASSVKSPKPRIKAASSVKSPKPRIEASSNLAIEAGSQRSYQSSRQSQSQRSQPSPRVSETMLVPYEEEESTTASSRRSAASRQSSRR